VGGAVGEGVGFSEDHTTEDRGIDSDDDPGIGWPGCGWDPSNRSRRLVKNMVTSSCRVGCDEEDLGYRMYALLNNCALAKTPIRTHQSFLAIIGTAAFS
jgi:hypothetical protein